MIIPANSKILLVLVSGGEIITVFYYDSLLLNIELVVNQEILASALKYFFPVVLYNDWIQKKRFKEQKK